MSAWRTVLILTRREVVERGRSRTFLLTAVFTLVIIAGAILVPALVGDGETTYAVGVAGDAGRDVLAAASSLDEDIRFEVVELSERQEAEEALAAGDVEAVLLGPKTLLVERAPGELFGSPLVGILQQAAATARLQALVEAGGDTTAQVVDVLTSEPLAVESLTGPTGGTADRETFAIATEVLMYIAVLTYGAWTLTGVTEEKTNRIVEVLLATVRPWHLLTAKVVGIGLLGLAQLAVTLAVVMGLIAVTGSAELPDVPVWSAAALLLWFLVGYGIYSVLFAMLGSLVSRPEEAQTVSFPVTILIVVAFFAGLEALEEPDGTLAVVATLIPFTAAFVAPVRSALGALPAWQAGTSVLIAAATTYGLVRLGGRVYSGGILRTGGRVKLREAYRSAEM